MAKKPASVSVTFAFVLVAGVVGMAGAPRNTAPADASCDVKHLRPDSANLIKNPEKLELKLKLDEYVKSMEQQFSNLNARRVQANNASKQSPFKFPLGSKHEVNIGIALVVLPPESLRDMIQQVQSKTRHFFGKASRMQTAPHITLGALVLDTHSAEAYNHDIKTRKMGVVAKVRKYLEQEVEAPIARIQELKLTTGGSMTVQLQHDEAQNIALTEGLLDAHLRLIPTIGRDSKALADEKRKFQQRLDGDFEVTKLQQVRLLLGMMGSDIKGLDPAGHLVLLNLINPDLLQEFGGPRNSEAREELWRDLFHVWSPFQGKDITLTDFAIACYVERSLNKDTSVLAPEPGKDCTDLYGGEAHSIMKDVFVADRGGNPFIDLEAYNRPDKYPEA